MTETLLQSFKRLHPKGDCGLSDEVITKIISDWCEKLKQELTDESTGGAMRMFSLFVTHHKRNHKFLDNGNDKR